MAAGVRSRYSRRVFPPHTPVGRIGEKALLRYIRSRVSHGRGVSIGIGDDAAAVETGPLTLMTTDSLVEGVHFRREWAPDTLLGRKALSVNLSDIDAMGGVPRYATVSLCLPADTPFAFVEGFYDGLLSRTAQTGVEIVGGNLSGTSGAIVVDITVLGHGQPLLRRSGALPGDVVMVTGRLGAAAMGVRLLGVQVSTKQRLLFNARPGSGSLFLGSACLEGTFEEIQPSKLLARILVPGGGIAKCGASGFCFFLPLLMLTRRVLGDVYKLPGRQRRIDPALSLLTAQGAVPLVPRSHEHFGGGG